jgi:CubicO group peptidase (beta-lactamase class C family)
MMRINLGSKLSILVTVFLASLLFGSSVLAQALATNVAVPDPRSERVVNGLLPSFVTTETTAMNLAQRMAFYKVPAVSIAVIDKGKVVWSRGFGVANVQTQALVNDQTVFQAASISKPVSALGALRMVEVGQLTLDGDVNASLRSWQVPPSELIANQKVSLRLLLSHSAGLSVSGFPGYVAGVATPTAKQVLEGTPPANNPAVKVFYTPKSKVEYSGGGFTVLQQLMMDVRGASFNQLMTDLILEPVGMTNSTFAQPLTGRYLSNVAVGHDNNQAILGLYRTHPELAAAGLWTTSADLAKFAIAVQNAQRTSTVSGQAVGASVSNLLSPALANELLTVQSWPYGLGFVLEGQGTAARFSHRGANIGYQCILIGFKNQDSGLVILTNANSGNGLIQEIIRAVATEYQWPALAPKRYEVKALAPALQEQFVGYYQDSRGQVVRIRLHDGQLIGQSDDVWATLAWLENDQFAIVDQQSEITLSRDAQSKVSAASISKEGQILEGFAKLPEPKLPLDTQPIYLRGSFNNWGLVRPMSMVDSQTYTARVELAAGFAEFKLADQNFSAIDFGVLPNVKPAPNLQNVTLVPKGKNIQLIVEQAGLYEFTLIAKPQADVALSVRRIP